MNMFISKPCYLLDLDPHLFVRIRIQVEFLSGNQCESGSKKLICSSS